MKPIWEQPNTVIRWIRHKSLHHLVSFLLVTQITRLKKSSKGVIYEESLHRRSASTWWGDREYERNGPQLAGITLLWLPSAALLYRLTWPVGIPTVFGWRPNWLAASAANHIRRDWCGGPQYTLLHSHRLLVVGGSGADSAYWNITCNYFPSHFHNNFDWI